MTLQLTLASGATALGSVMTRYLETDPLPQVGFLDTLQTHSHNEFTHADVAELADAQVSEACDGDIVEVQVLSSAPTLLGTGRARIWRSPFVLSFN